MIAMSYVITQILVKVFLTLLIAAPAVLGIRWVWSLDVDIQKTVSPKKIAERLTPKQSFIVAREENALYQEGEVKAVVEGCIIDEAAALVSFEEISKSGQLDLSKPFEFRRYVLNFVMADSVIGMRSDAPEKGRIITKVKCSIRGIR